MIMTPLIIKSASIILLVLLAYTNAAPTEIPTTDDEVNVTAVTENPEDNPPLVTNLPDEDLPSVATDSAVVDSVTSDDKQSGDDIPEKGSEIARESTTNVQDEQKDSNSTDSSVDVDINTEENLQQVNEKINKTTSQQSETVSDTQVSQEIISDVNNLENNTNSNETAEIAPEVPEIPNDNDSAVQLKKDQTEKINKADDSDNEILNETQFNGKLLQTEDETSGKLKIVAVDHDEESGKTSDKVEILIEPSSKEELAPQNAIDVTIYNIETNNQDTLDIEIKPLASEEGSQESNSTVEGSGSKISDEVFDTMLYLNASEEVVTTRYFSSEEFNGTELHSEEDHSNLTTIEPIFSDEKLELQELSVENKGMSASNESMSSEAINTKYHEDINSEEPSEEVVTTRYLSLESFEDDRNKTEESMERSNLTTVNPFSKEYMESSESIEHVVMINKIQGPQSRRIVLVTNSRETESIEETAHEISSDGEDDDNIHVLQAKPEEMIPIHGITSEEAFELIEKSGRKVQSGEVEYSHGNTNGSNNNTNIEVGLENGPSTELSYGTSEDSSTVDYDEFGVETVQPLFSDEDQMGEMVEPKTVDEPSIDGQVLGLMRGMIFNLR